MWAHTLATSCWPSGAGLSVLARVADCRASETVARRGPKGASEISQDAVDVEPEPQRHQETIQ